MLITQSKGRTKLLLDIKKNTKPRDNPRWYYSKYSWNLNFAFLRVEYCIKVFPTDQGAEELIHTDPQLPGIRL